MESLNYEILSSIVNEIYFNCPRVAHNFFDTTSIHKDINHFELYQCM